MTLSNADREAIYQAYRNGETSRSIAARYGIHHAYVRTLFKRLGAEKRDVKTRAAAVVEFHKKHPTASAAIISRRCAVKLSYVYHVAQKYRLPIARKRRDDRASFIVPADAMPTLTEHAARREISVNALIAKMVIAIAEDDMVDAILDDGGVV